MSVDEFQRKYHNYSAADKAAAVAEARKVNSVSLGFLVSAVHFRDQGAWCLMVDTAIQGMKDIGMELETAR